MEMEMKQKSDPASQFSIFASLLGLGVLLALLTARHQGIVP
jgi:hypothetical protein